MKKMIELQKERLRNKFMSPPLEEDELTRKELIDFCVSKILYQYPGISDREKSEYLEALFAAIVADEDDLITEKKIENSVS